MQCLKPLVLLQSLAGWCLGKVAPADLATQTVGCSCSETFGRAKDKGVRAQCLPAAAQPSWM